MKELVFYTNPSYVRPIIRISHLWSALIDTGADIPVCYLDREVLLPEPLNAKLVLSRKQIKGVGRVDVKGDVYVIPYFLLGEIVYPYLPIFVPLETNDSDEEDMTHFIISASMLYGLRYEFNTPNNTFNISVPDNESLVRHPKIIIDDELLVFEEK